MLLWGDSRLTFIILTDVKIVGATHDRLGLRGRDCVRISPRNALSVQHVVVYAYLQTL